MSLPQRSLGAHSRPGKAEAHATGTKPAFNRMMLIDTLPRRPRMTLPHFFYTEPQFRASSPDFAKLKAAPEWTIDTPGIGLALALDYYRVEAFATEKDRDAACGPTAHEDVRYVPVGRRDLGHDDTGLDNIACGYAVDQPRFDEIVTPIFDTALKQLIGDLMEAPKEQTGIVASIVIPIARVRYTILAERVGDWIKFPVKGLAVFERVDQDLIDRTADWLHNRLILKASPPTDSN
jgi:hypothetical protein